MKLPCAILILLMLVNVPHSTGNTSDDPVSIGLGSTAGNLENAGDSIWYNFTVEQLYRYNITLYGASETDFDLYIYNGTTGEEIRYSASNSYPDYIVYEAIASGSILIRVYAYFGSGSFILDISKEAIAPGEHYANPIITNNVTITGTIENAYQSIWYQYEVNTSYAYYFELTSKDDNDLDMFIYSSKLVFLDSSTRFSYPDEIMLTSRYNGTILIEIFADSGIGNFSISTMQYSLDKGDSPVMPQGITTGHHLDDIEVEGLSRWYQFAVEYGYHYTFILETEGIADYDLYLYNSTLDKIEGVDARRDIDIISYYCMTNTSFLIEVRSEDGTGTFSLNITSYQLKPGDWFHNPIAIAPGAFNDSLFSEEYSRWYRLNVSQNYRYGITLDSDEDIDLDVTVYDRYMEELYSSSRYYYPEEIDFIAESMGYVLIEVEPFDGVGNFTLSVVEALDGLGDSSDNPMIIDLGITSSYIWEDMGNKYLLLEVEGGFNYTLSLTSNSDYDFDMSVYNENDEIIASAESTTYPDVVSFDVLSDQNLTIRVYGYSFYAYGAFSLEVTREPFDISYIPPSGKNPGGTTSTSSFLVSPLFEAFVLVSILIIVHRRRYIS